MDKHLSPQGGEGSFGVEKTQLSEPPKSEKIASSAISTSDETSKTDTLSNFIEQSSALPKDADMKTVLTVPEHNNYLDTAIEALEKLMNESDKGDYQETVKKLKRLQALDSSQN